MKRALDFFWHCIIGPKDIQMLIVEYIIEYFLLASCQKKRYEQGYDILKEFVSK